MKKCSKCGEDKELDEFHKDKTRSLGVVPACKSCHAQYHKKRYSDPEVVKKFQENNRQYKQENKDKIKQQKEAKKLTEEYKNKQKIKRIKFKQNNPDYAKNTMRARRKNPIHKLAMQMRGVINKAYKKIGISKNHPMLTHVGISIPELQVHLINSALRNYGFYLYDENYHIDHIVPLSSAASEEALLALNHYTNLQLLYPEDNLKKSNKVLT